MSKTIKRSMSVNPHPVVHDAGGRVRFPTRGWDTGSEWPYDHAWDGGTWGYKIKRVTNSIEYRPGWALSKEQVQKLIDDNWTVSVLT